MMRKSRKNKIMAGSMALVMAVSMAGVSCWHNMSAAEVKAADEDVETLKKAASEALGDTDTKTDGVYKDETVYVKADAAGKVTDTTVSEWLKNPGSGALEDTTGLKDIKNVKGDETFTEKGEDAVTWDAEGNDIYYQGRSEESLPVDVTITYKLDGKKISAKKLEGKSGKLEIHIDYKNHSRQTVKVDGKDVEMYTPFTMVTALLLPTDQYKNVTVDSGKIVSDADKDIVLGLGFPGLTENLNLQDVDVEIPESVTITADAKKVSVGTTITVVSADLLDKFGLNDVSDFDSFSDSIDELSDAASQLKDGSRTLADGVNTLNSKTGDLKSGVNELADGVNAYAGGVSQLAQGSSEVAAGAQKLKDGATQAQQGIYDAKTGADALVAGYDDQSTGAVVAANALSSNLSALSQKLGSGSTSVQLTDAQKAEISAAANAMAQAAAQNITDDMFTTMGMTREAYIQSLAAAFVPALTEKITAVAQNAASTTSSAIKGSVDQLAGVAQKLAGGVGELRNGTASLQDGLGRLSDGSAELVNGTADLYDGAAALQQGVAALNEKSSLLITGTSKLKDGSSQMGSGVSQLADGAGTLADGMSEFKADGIDKLTEVFKGDIEGVTSRINAMMTLGQNYRSFGGIQDGMDGSTKFIIETEAAE